MRYHHSLWQELKPKVLQGVHTTLVLALPQIGLAYRPTSSLKKCFCSLVRWQRNRNTFSSWMWGREGEANPGQGEDEGLMDALQHLGL